MQQNPYTNPGGSLIGWIRSAFGDLFTYLFGQRSDESLAAETVAGFQTRLQSQYANLAQGGSSIGDMKFLRQESENQVNALKRDLATHQAKMAKLSGHELAVAQQLLATKQRMLLAANAQFTAMDMAYKKALDDMAKAQGYLSLTDMERQQAEFDVNLELSVSARLKIQEEFERARGAALGVLDTPVKDYRRELRRRNARREGAVEAMAAANNTLQETRGQQMASMAQPLSAEEQAALDAIMTGTTSQTDTVADDSATTSS